MTLKISRARGKAGSRRKRSVFGGSGIAPTTAGVALSALFAMSGCDRAPAEKTSTDTSIQPASSSAPAYTLFESGQVRPIALSANGKFLYAANTPDNRLEIFKVGGEGTLTHALSVPVGLEPVAVASRNDTEVWVVNHLSDSVSIVKHDSKAETGSVVRTVLVGDEPRDIVFAGPGKSRAFITTAHRGQNVPFDPQLTTPSVGRADVWVFDANNLGASLGGTPLTVVTLFTDTPRALAATPDGSTVYAAGFHTGNRTASVHEFLIPDGGEAEGGMPGPLTNYQGIRRPETGIIVRYDGTHWRDSLGRIHDDKMRFTLPDKDVFAINALANPPRQRTESGFYAGVGTILFNMAVNPKNGAVYVSNTDANNMTEFEGPGQFAGKSVRGHIAESRITVIKGGQVLPPRHLNKHIDYSTCCADVPNAENQASLALPQMMQVSDDGKTLYVAALGSSKVGVYSTQELEQDTFVPNQASQIVVSGGGPTGLALDDKGKRLYVLTRFDNSISIIDTAQKREIGHVRMYSPEPTHIVQGRRLLYDASFTSSHGDSACASCHVFGDFDSLGWNLGNPDAEVATINNPLLAPDGTILPWPAPPRNQFHPMKGPMTTQSLRGMANHGPMHWRGDRTGSETAASAQPDSGAFDEAAGFKKFQAGFTGLLGRAEPIPNSDMEAFTAFILDLTYPPNPIRRLDNSLTTQQQEGRDIFFNAATCVVVPGAPCQKCHTLDAAGNQGLTAHPGFFGTSGITLDFNFGDLPLLKIPHLRNMYQKVGRFGFPFHPLLNPNDDTHTGEQVRGFGFIHDGSFDSVFRFHNAGFIFPQGEEGDRQKRAAEAFVLAFDSNLAPIVGQQITLNASTSAVVNARINLLIARAEQGECDLVAKTVINGRETGYLYAGAGKFMTSRRNQPPIPEALLRAVTLFSDRSLTYTCVPRGAGVRIGIDRDLDGAYDGDELAAGSDPADPTSRP